VSIERAGDVAAAGLQLGKLGGTCAACHVAERAKLTFAYEPPPLQDDTLESQMALHEWAGARLWQGLIGPADAPWLEGARAMRAARFDAAKSVHAKPNARVMELGELLHEQAREAGRTTDREARAQLYGHMMTTCSSCHAIVRPAPVARGVHDQR
jgi:cytochrome c553